jgi:hypothetical protein
MLLRDKTKPRSLSILYSNSTKAFKKIKIKGLLLFFFYLAILASFLVSAVYIKAWISSGHLTQLHKDTIQRKLGVLTHFKNNFISHFPSSVDIPKLHIDIKFKNYQKLSRKREEALRRSILITEPESYVPAEIRYKDKIVKVKLRLKGDVLDHLGGDSWRFNRKDKWSFRIKVKKGNALFGMRKFSIQHPMTRDYESEILFYKALERERLMVLRYFFVRVFINGTDIGLMALEEHPSKELLEFNGRRDGPILKFDDSLFWQAYLSPYSRLSEIFMNYKVSQLMLIGANLKKKPESFQSHFVTAVGLLRGFINEKISAAHVFDPDSTARYLALAKVWGGEHSLVGGNGRFYYNPLIEKFEIIGHDASISASKPIFQHEDSMVKRMLQDKEIKSLYREALKKIDNEFKEGVTLKWAQKLKKENLEILQREFFEIEGLDLNKIKERASNVVKLDEELFRSYPDYLKVYYLKNHEGNDVLEIINTLPEPVSVTSIKEVNRLTGKTQTIKFPIPSVLPFTLNRTSVDFSETLDTPLEENIIERIKLSPPQVKTIVLDKVYNLQEHQIQVYANIEGDNETKIYDATLYHPTLNKVPNPDPTVEQILSTFPFITRTGPNTLSIKQGQWNISDWLFVPAEMKLIIPRGTVLRFNSSVGLIARGPVMINGVIDNPTILRGSGLAKKKNSWQGVFISQTEEASVWSNVFVLDTAGISKNGWNVTAGVTFYKADAVMKNVSFLRNLCEDAINIVHSNFKLENVEIKNALSDGFDADFSKGFIRQGRFENIGSVGGGDAIDVAGTTIDINGIKFKNIKDKAVSVGENSTMTATHLLIEKVGAGVVSKDSSRVSLTDSVIREFQTAALMAYKKKALYGPASIVAKNLRVQNLPASVLAQKGSQILIDGVTLPTSDLNIKNFYSTTMKGGLK